jgi:transcriptional regulator with XRE-family HTH domain
MPEAVEPPRFGVVLRGQRIANGLTQEEVAAATGLSVRAISNLERGCALTPQSRSLHALLSTVPADEQQRCALHEAARHMRAQRVRTRAQPASSTGPGELR